jgi:hypothetical protein
MIVQRRGRRVCDAKCHNARSFECKCVCDGVNHGVLQDNKTRSEEDKLELIVWCSSCNNLEYLSKCEIVDKQVVCPLCGSYI